MVDDAQTPFFALPDGNKDGKLDLYAVSRTASATEVVVLDGANHFLSKLSQDVTPLPPLAADDKTSVLVGDADGDGHPDVFVIARGATASGMTEVTILSGADKFQTVLRRGPTALGTTMGGPGTWTFDLAAP